MKNYANLLFVLLGIISFVFLGCAKKDSSSSSSTADTGVSAESGTAAITLSSKISVVDAKSTASTARIGARTANAIDTTAFASTVDYNVDDTGTFVYEQSAEALSTVNDILCQIGQARGDLMINEGNYKAQIDKSKCSTQSGDSKSGAPTYEMWILNISRESGKPMKVKGWVPNGDGIIYFKGEWYRSPSDDYPLGHFFFHFEQREGTTTSGEKGFYGFMKALKSGDTTTLQFYQSMDSSTWGLTAGTEMIQSVTATFNSDESGTGKTNLPSFTCGQSGCEYDGQKTYDLAFNDEYFYKQKSIAGTASDAVCLDRNKYITSAWRYGLYDSNGARKTISSGFPITDSTGDYNGYIGYYGLWMPSAASVDNGSTVKKLDFDNPDSEGDSYTVLSYGGKLTKYEKQSITLGSIKNIPFEWFDMSVYASKRVYWDGSNFKIDGQRVNGYWVDNDTSTLTLTASNVPYGFFFYSRALGGDGQIELAYPYGRGTAPNAPADNSTVVFNTQTPIFPGDTVPSVLACYSNCPDPGTIATGQDYQGASTSVYLPSKWNWGTDIDNVTGPTPYTYTFDNTTSGMVLKYENDNGTGPHSITLSSANQNLPWGFRSGILFDNSTFDNDTTARQADYAALTCDWDARYLCPWQARGGLDTFYIWQTGTDDWQKLTVLVDSNNTSVSFDPPMIVKYTHSGTSSNSGKNYDNASFYLEYGGFGDLWGVPSYCVLTKNGEKADCADADLGTTRWVNEFVIPATSIVTQAGGTTEYVVKPLEVEQTMPKTSSTSVCTGAGLSLGGVSLPDVSEFVSPVDDVGTKPEVTGPPTIVGGEKKGS